MFKKILVTNDDSLSYEGIKILTEIAKNYADEVLVVAPHTEKSACSHSLTLKTNVKLYKEKDIIEGVKTYSVDGTPADCVKVAKLILNFNFDCIFSGINNGFNLADDICYSGTVSAALEAEFLDSYGIAFSTAFNDLTGSRYIKDAIEFIKKENLFKKARVINVNLPQVSKGIKITKQGKRAFNGKYISVGENLYKSVTADVLNSYIIREEDSTTSDFKAIEDGYISISLLTNDLNI